MIFSYTITHWSLSLETEWGLILIYEEEPVLFNNCFFLKIKNPISTRKKNRFPYKAVKIEKIK
jgi:hypothetical protein